MNAPKNIPTLLMLPPGIVARLRQERLSGKTMSAIAAEALDAYMSPAISSNKKISKLLSPKEKS